MGGPWDIPYTDSEPGKARWLAKGNPEEMPHERDSIYHEGANLSLSPPVCLSTHTVCFFLLINTLLASLLSISMWKFISTQLMGQGLVTGHWSLVVWWLGFGTLTATARPQFLARNWNPVLSCCRPRPPEKVIAPSPWVLVCTRLCVYPPRVEPLFSPVLWKSCNQIPLAFKARFSADSSSSCQIPRLGRLTWGSEPSVQWENFCGIIILQFVGRPPGCYGIWFYRDCAPPTFSLWLLLCLWM